jgi:hypothetical protein
VSQALERQRQATPSLLDCLTDHGDIVEIGSESWRFKSRENDQTTGTRPVSATPMQSRQGRSRLIWLK